MQIEPDRTIQQEYINSIATSLAVIGLRKDGIAEIRFTLDDYEVDVVTQQEIHDAFLKFTDNGRVSYHIVVIPGLYGGITKEAREMEMFEAPGFKNQHSLAIVTPNLAQRLLGTLYLSLKKRKPKYPYKLFSSEEVAIEWILSQNVK